MVIQNGTQSASSSTTVRSAEERLGEFFAKDQVDTFTDVDLNKSHFYCRIVVVIPTVEGPVYTQFFEFLVT
jgi:hypothetical protein